MKRGIAIFFLALFLMYHIGYLGYYWYSVQELNDQWVSHVEITQDMKHVTIPIALPYWTETEYRPSHGTINIDGKQYRTVMEKYSKDAIHLIVAQDRGTEQLRQHIADWIKMMNTADSDHSGSSKANFLKSVSKDYLNFLEINLQEDFWEIKNTSYNYIFSERLANRSLDVITPPPQA